MLFPDALAAAAFAVAAWKSQSHKSPVSVPRAAAVIPIRAGEKPDSSIYFLCLGRKVSHWIGRGSSATRKETDITMCHY